MAIQVDAITIGGLAPVYAIYIGCAADGTEKSTDTSLMKVSLSARFFECLRATARAADSVVGIVGGAVACDQHEISVVKGNFRVVDVRDVRDNIAPHRRPGQREVIHAARCKGFIVKLDPHASSRRV